MEQIKKFVQSTKSAEFFAGRIFKDGEYTGFYIYSREIFNDGGYDTYSYGFWKAYELLDEAILGSIGGIYDMPN